MQTRRTTNNASLASRLQSAVLNAAPAAVKADLKAANPNATPRALEALAILHGDYRKACVQRANEAYRKAPRERR